MAGNGGTKVKGSSGVAGEAGTFSVPGVRRVQFKLLFDEVAYTGASGTVRVFNAPAGKRADQTNVRTAEQLPFREEYDCFAISLIPNFQANVPADLALFYDGVAMIFKINNKPVFEAPVCFLTAGCGLEGVAGYADASGAPTLQIGYYHNGIASPGAIARFPEPYHIGKGENFSIDLQTDTAIGGLSAPFQIKVLMHGIIRTLVQ